MRNYSLDCLDCGAAPAWPCFPTFRNNHPTVTFRDNGKTLRDEFAMAAMGAISPVIESDYFKWEEMAAKCYAYADALLAAREAK